MNKHQLIQALHLGAAFLMAVGSAHAADDLVVADFEGATHGAWKVEGTAFGSGPARGTLPNQMDVSGFSGTALVNSFNGGDAAVGKLTSPPFAIARPYINFLIGGGKDADKLAIRLLIDGQVVRRATGENDRQGGSEALDWQSWDVKEYNGKQATLEIVDAASGGWGHISVDQITQSDAPKTPAPRERQIAVTARWLLLPVKNGAPGRDVTVSVSGKPVRFFGIELADGDPDWWAPLDLTPFQGQTITVKVNVLSQGSRALTQIRQEKDWPGGATLYQEPLRGQFHFSSRVGWVNDPNGLVYSQGQYHLFYQHNPYGARWGNMQWGHAVSSDLVHWSELPTAIYPHAPGDGVFSGSAVVDKNNTSGWKKGDNDLLVAAFTSTSRGECIAYSNDKGLTWTEYEGNPVVTHKTEGRDPRLIWHEPTHQWVMAIYDVDKTQPIEGEQSAINFYTSPDLKKWTYQSRVGGWYECADLFELPTENGQTKWVLTAASSEYRIGTFDGKKFVPETPKLPGQRARNGRDYYAAQTFSSEPKSRRVQMAWFWTDTPGMPFNQSMSLPNELKLKSTPEGPRLTWTPVPELEALRTQTHSMGAVSLAEGAPNPLAALHGELVEIRAEFEPGTANEIAFNVRGVPIVYDATQSQIVVGGMRASAPLQGGKQRLTIYLDRTGIEVYASDGLAFVPLPINVKADDTSLAVSTRGGTARFSRLDVYNLRSTWTR